MDIREQTIKDLKEIGIVDLNCSFEDYADYVIAEIEKARAIAIGWAYVAIGWAYADCCSTLDSGKDPRQTEMGDVLKRANKELIGEV